MCANNTPLPSWLSFNPDDLSFSGTTPESTSPAELTQTVGIDLVASDVVGFAGAVATFQLVIESHLFKFGKNTYTLNVRPGDAFNYTGLQNDLLFDGLPVKPSDLTQVTAQTPAWVVFDTQTLLLSGTVPLLPSSQNVTVCAKDVYGDQSNTAILIQTTTDNSDLFSDAEDTLDATIGSNFKYDLSGILNTSPNLLVTVDLGNASSWLKFESSKLQLTGNVSNDMIPQQILLNITAREDSRCQSKIVTLSITRDPRGSNSSSISPSKVITTIPTPSITSQPRSPAAVPIDSESNRRRKEAAAVTVPLVIILIGLLILSLRFRRKRQERSKRGYLNPFKENISYPIQTMEHREVAPEDGLMRRKSAEQKRTSLLPRIDWRLSRLRSSRATVDEAINMPKSGSWQEEVVRAVPEFSLLPEERPSTRGNALNYSSSAGRSKNSRVSSLNCDSPVKRLSRQIKARSHIDRASSLLLSTHRVSGVGHGHSGFHNGNPSFSCSTVGAGHGIGGPPGYGRIRQSLHNASILSGSSWASTSTSTNMILNNGSSSHYLRSEPSQLSSTMRSFPHPPTMNSFDLLARTHTIHEDSSSDRHRRPSVAYPSRTHQRALSPKEAFLKRRARARQTPNPPIYPRP